MLIIFDIDGTLIDTNEEGTDPIEVEGCRLKISKRPGFDEFMNYCFANFDVGFWTAASSEYAHYILKLYLTSHQLEKVKFIYTEVRCTQRCMYTGVLDNYRMVIKPLKKIWDTKWAKTHGWSKFNTLIIENTPSTCLLNYGNAIYVPTYTYNTDDKILYHLINYLESIKLSTNVRAIEKRYWLVPFQK